MKKKSKLIGLSILLIAPYLAHADEILERVMSTEESKVLSTIEAMTAAFHAGDIDGIMKTYQHDAKVAFMPGSPLSNPVQIRQGFQEAFSIKPRFTYGDHEVVVTGNIAVHTAPWVMKGEAPDGSPVEQKGLSVAVLQRQENGEWLIAIDNPHGDHLNGR